MQFDLDLTTPYSRVDRESFHILANRILRFNWVPQQSIQLELYTFNGILQKTSVFLQGKNNLFINLPT